MVLDQELYTAEPLVLRLRTGSILSSIQSGSVCMKASLPMSIMPAGACTAFYKLSASESRATDHAANMAFPLWEWVIGHMLALQQHWLVLRHEILKCLSMRLLSMCAKGKGVHQPVNALPQSRNSSVRHKPA